MNIDEAKQIVEEIFSPHDSEIEPNNKETGTFDLVVFKDKDKSKSGTYSFSQLDISNMSKSKFLILVKEKRKLLQGKNCGYIFDKS